MTTLPTGRAAEAGRPFDRPLRVLLIGEASGVHWTLKTALEDLGHHCDLLIQQGLESQRPYDISLGVSGTGLVNQIKRNTLPILRAMRLENYDVVNFLNAITSQNGRYAKYKDIPILRKKCRVMSYYAVGCDELGLIMMNRGRLPYTPCDTCYGSTDQLGQDCKLWIRDHHEQGVGLAEQYFDVGFGSMVEYDHARHAFDPGNFVRVPFPIDAEKIPFAPATLKDRPLVVHTPTRRAFKGTDTVLSAVDLLRRTRDDFDFEVVEGLGYQDYLRVIRTSDVVIDQIFSQSPGMNALELMAMGKVVMTGATDLGRSYFPFMADMPAYDAPPNATALAAALDRVLDDKAGWGHLAARGRDYVVENYDRHEVARTFLDGWYQAMASENLHATA